MTDGYFHRVRRETPTRVWVNNPTGADLEHSIRAGAISGTTNPAYCSKLLSSEPEYIRSVIDEVVAIEDDDERAADLVYQRVSARFMEAFLPIFERSRGTEGFVTMQDDPRKDEEAEVILEAAQRHSRVGTNYLAKIPVIESGMEAMEELVRRDMPICATESFAIAQMTAMCELYERTSNKCGHSPAFFITHITGIFDEDLAEYASANRIDIAPGILAQAGCIVARKQYRLLNERGYRAVMLGGGARGPQHFTEFVGGNAHVTLNWSTMDELLRLDPPVISRIQTRDDPQVIAELREKLPPFRQAYDDDGVEPRHFNTIPALQRFRNAFIRGWEHLLSEVARRRAVVA